MTRLEEIYERVYGELSEGRQADNELTQLVEEKISSMDLPSEDKEEISEIIFIGSSYGQKHGFCTGFRFAMALIFESLAG